MSTRTHHCEGDVGVGRVGVGGGQLAHVLDLPVILILPLDALLSQQPHLVVHVRDAHVELVVLEQQSLGRRRQVRVRLAPVIARHVHHMHQNVFLQPTTAMNEPVRFPSAHFFKSTDNHTITRMWANAQPDGRPVEHRWRPLFNAPKFG